MLQLVYFTALFPYCILVILLVRAATLPGYMDGIEFYLTPQWHRLADINVSRNRTLTRRRLLGSDCPMLGMYGSELERMIFSKKSGSSGNTDRNYQALSSWLQQRQKLTYFQI